MFNTDPDRAVNEILDDIKTGAVQSFAPGQSNPGFVLAPFAALLVKLSRNSEATAASVNTKTQQLIVLTRWLIGLTVVIVVLTVPLVYVEFSKFLSETSKFPRGQQQSNGGAGQNDQESNRANKWK